MERSRHYFFKSFLITLSTFLVFIGHISAQISSPGSNYHDTIDYPDYDGIDMYYIYNAPEDRKEPVYGSLTAVPPGGTAGWDFEWSRYDTLITDFSVPFHTDTGVPSSTVSNLESGGYRVHIQSADIDTFFRAWVFINDPVVEVEKNAEGKLKDIKSTCDYIQLDGFVQAGVHYYYDLLTGQKDSLPNGMSFLWTSDNPDVTIPAPSYWLNPRLGSDLPSIDTWFILTAVDSFGLSRDDSVYYETIHTKAGFSLLYEDSVDQWVEEPDDRGAPLTVRFVNLSENGVEFQWTFIDSAKAGDIGEEFSYDSEDTLEFTYYIPGYYYPKLTSISEEGCVDSFPNPIQGEPIQEIYVEPSKLEVMNVFTPNDDNVNDYFVVDARSLRQFRISIYNRWGRLVYRHEQTDEKFEWLGWDGTIDGKGKSKAEPGVYYYVIEALGWDAEKYRGGVYRGFFYLIRNKNDAIF
jgi:gliding motility-associated-like protein